MTGHIIRIHNDVAERLAELAVDGESPNAVLRRLFDLPPTQSRFSNFKEKSRPQTTPWYPEEGTP